MDEAVRCDNLVLLREGSILAQAPPAEVRRRTGRSDLVSMFLVTSITMLRERTSGTLERLLTLPLEKLDLLFGYAIAFAALAAVQATIVSLVGLGLLDVTAVSSKALVIALAVAHAVLGMALGLFLSAFARTEFQAVQFMPAFILPQILLCGLLVPRDEMAEWLQWLSAVMPFTYAYDALERAATEPELGAAFWIDVLVVCAVTVLALALGAGTSDAGRRDHAAFTAVMSLRIESFASPKSIVVFESR